MKVVTELRKYKFIGRSVVAIGVFDGVHKAHRRIILSAVRAARRSTLQAVVVTFWPHPQGKKSLYSLTHRIRLIEELGVDVCVAIRFTKNFARLSAEDFVKDILVGKLNCRAVYIGKNFRFGANAQGSVRTLRRLSHIYDFRVRVFGVQRQGRYTISSTLVRSLIVHGRLQKAREILLRPVTIFGEVIQGSSRGKRLGFPTANIDPHHEIVPPPGIYAVRVIFKNKKLAGAGYIGERPTFTPPPVKPAALSRGAGFTKNRAHGKGSAPSIEVNIFNFKKNIYGKQLEVRFIRKIRDDKKFPSEQALQKQIKKDIQNIKKILSRH